MSHLLYRDGEPALVIEVRSSFLVKNGEVYQTHPLDARARNRLYQAQRYRPEGREKQRSRIRERILATGRTSAYDAARTKAILRQRIAAKAKR